MFRHLRKGWLMISALVIGLQTVLFAFDPGDNAITISDVAVHTDGKQQGVLSVGASVQILSATENRLRIDTSDLFLKTKEGIGRASHVFWVDAKHVRSPKEAISIFKAQLEDKAKEDVALFLARANAHRMNQNYEAALADCDSASRLDPRNSLSFALQGALLLDRGDAADAIKSLSKAIELKPDFSWALCVRGNAYSDVGNYDESIADCDRVLRTYPEYSDALYVRAVAHEMREDVDDAVRDYLAFVKADPKDARVAKAHLQLGTLRESQGEFEEAISEYCQGIELSTDPTDGIYFRAACWARMGEFEKSYAEVGRMLAAAPAGKGKARALSERAGISVIKGDMPRAIEDLTAAAKLAPSLETLVERAQVFLLANENQKAIEDSSFVIGLDSKNENAYWVRAAAFASMGRHADAISDYSRAHELNPKNLDVIANRGTAWLSLGDFNQAIADLDTALEKIRLNPNLFRARGEAWFQKADYRKAVADFNKAIELNGSHPLYYRRRAACWEKLGEADKATVDTARAKSLEDEIFEAIDAIKDATDKARRLDN